jgi:hypothetical protein
VRRRELSSLRRSVQAQAQAPPRPGALVAAARGDGGWHGRIRHTLGLLLRAKEITVGAGAGKTSTPAPDKPNKTKKQGN